MCSRALRSQHLVNEVCSADAGVITATIVIARATRSKCALDKRKLLTLRRHVVLAATSHLVSTQEIE